MENCSFSGEIATVDQEKKNMVLSCVINTFQDEIEDLELDIHRKQETIKMIKQKIVVLKTLYVSE